MEAPGHTPKAYTLGTHRAASPDVPVGGLRDRLEHFGITRVADITGLDRVGVPVMAVYRPDARSLAVSLGKGVTPAAAVASGVMESIELWCAERPSLPIVSGRARDLAASHRLIDWSGLPQIAAERFDAQTPTAWVEVVSLVDGGVVLAPYECIHVDGRIPEPAGGGWFASTSNGLASGNNVAEAQVHALCEVIERDAVTLWRLGGRIEETAIDVGAVTDPACQALLARVEAADLSVLLHDATSDIGVAVVHCTLLERDPGPDLTLYATSGMGCHPSPAIALSRAVTEAAQSRLTLISGARDDLSRARYNPPPDRARGVNRLRLEPASAPRAFAELPDLSTTSLEGDLAAVLSALLARGFHAFWADLAQPGLGLAVGRALVPGLELLNDVETYSPGPRARAVIEAVSAQ